MSDPNSAEFDSYNIRDDQEITSAVREEAKRRYDQAFGYVWNQDSKTNWIDAGGMATEKPGTVQEWSAEIQGMNQAAALGMGSGRYSDLETMINEAESFFETATEKQIRAALKPPNDMGKFAKSQWDKLINEKNKQDNLFLANERPDTAASDSMEADLNARKCEEYKRSFGEAFSDEQLEKDCKQLSEDTKRAAAIAEAEKKAAEETRKASAAIVPAKSFEFKQQNFLQAKLIDIIRHRHAIIDRDKSRQKTYPYVGGSPNASIMLHGDPATCVNDLLVYTDTEQFLKMKSEEIANLQPEIRLFKTVTDKSTGEDKNIEIKFDTHLTQRSLESILFNSKKRNTGVGIKDFSLSFVGTDPFAANKSFKATLRIFANSFDELFVPRGKQGLRYRYVDLALKTSKALNDAVVDKLNAHKVGILSEDLARLDFALKIKLGLKMPTSTVAGNTALASAISRNTLTLGLTPTIHRFNFNEDGSLIFEIDYLPFQDQRFGGSNFDVFTNQKMRSLNLETKIKSKFARQECMQDMLDSIKKQSIDDLREVRTDAIASIIRDLHTHRRVNYLQIDPEVLKTFTQSAAQLSFEEILKLSEKAEFVGAEGTPESLKSDVAKDVEGGKKQDRIKTKVNSPTVPTIPYVFVSDIIDAVLAALTVGVSPLGMQAEIEGILSKLGADKQSQDRAIQNIADLKREYSRAVVDSTFGDSPGEITDEEMEKINNFSDQLSSQEDTLAQNKELRNMAYEMLDEYKRDFEDFRKFRVVLGPVELVNPFNSDDVLIASIGDIPISIPYLQEWLTSETLKDGVTKLSLSAFLNRLIMKLVKNALNDDSSFAGALKQKVRLAKTEALCTNQHESKMDDLTYNMIQTNKIVKKEFVDAFFDPMGELSYYQERYISENVGISQEEEIRTSRAFINYLSNPVLTSAESGSDPSQKGVVDREMNYLIFYSARTPPIGTYRGNRQEDSRKAVHHYSVGRDRGIIKNISLTRDSRPGIREARFEQEGFDGLQQLREVYNVDINCYANFNVFPGTKIFVDPRGWVPNLDSETLKQIGSVAGLTDFGIGGYHEVMKVDHTFGMGQFDTSFTAKWTMSSAPPKEKNEAGKPNEKSQSRCKTQKEEDSAERSAAQVRNTMQALGNEISVATSRVQALANPVLDAVTSGVDGFLDRVSGFFGNPSDAP